MKIHKFRAPPDDIVIEPLPFELNESAFSEWLGGLSFKDSYLACQKLYSVLKALERTVLDLRLEFTLLHSIVPIVDDLAERLEFSYLDSGFPLTEEELAKVEILGWTYTHLVTRFSLLYQQIETDGKNWTIADKAKSLYKAFYSAARLQLYANEVYASVHNGFWQECYQNYLRAEKSHLLDFPINESMGNDTTIQAVFKQILIFDICDTNCFRSREMKNLYGLLKNFSTMAAIMDKPSENQGGGMFQFNLDSDQSPKKWTPAIPAGDSPSRYIDVFPVAKSIYTTLQQQETGRNTLQSVNKELLFKVISMLSKKQKRKHTRFATQGNAVGFIGFNNVVSVIAKAYGKTADNLVPAPTYDPRIAGRWKEPDFDLVPIGDEFEHQLKQGGHSQFKTDEKTARIFQAGSHSEDWASANNERSRLLEEVAIGHFDVCNSSIKGYGLLWKRGMQKVKVGEIFGVEQDRGKRFEIGLVRRIVSQNDQALILGVELIGLESDMVWLARGGVNKSQGMLAIFIPAIAILKQPDSVIVANTQLKPGLAVVIFRNNDEVSCKLGNLLHSTPAVNHFELIYDANV